MRRNSMVFLTALAILSLQSCANQGPETTLNQLVSGEVAGAEQAAAIQTVRDELNALTSVPEGDELGTQIFISCIEGQDNWKVRDLDRFVCSAIGNRLVKWDGKPESAAISLDEYSRYCKDMDPVEPPLPYPPSALCRTPKGNYLNLDWYLAGETSVTIRCGSSEAMRCIENDPKDLASGRLIGEAARQGIIVNYYREQYNR